MNNKPSVTVDKKKYTQKTMLFLLKLCFWFVALQKEYLKCKLIHSGPANWGQLCRRTRCHLFSSYSCFPSPAPSVSTLSAWKHTLYYLLCVIKVQINPIHNLQILGGTYFQHRGEIKLKLLKWKNVQTLWPSKLVSCYLPASVSISSETHNH